jgi:predicted permease
MDNLRRDVQFGLRLLLKNPGFAAVVILALALGIGGNTAIFSVVYATLIEPLPYHEADRLVMVWSKPLPDIRNSVAPGDYVDWKSQSTVFKALHAWTARTPSLTLSDRPEEVRGSVGTPGWISNHGLRIRLGRDFVPEEGEVGKDHVVILSHRFWRDRMGSDPRVVGTTLRIDGSPHTVVGVIDAGPADRMQSQLYFPLAFRPDQLNHEFHYLLVMGRLKDGVTLEQANADMAVVAKRIADAFPAAKKGWGVSVEPLQNNFLSRSTIQGLWFLLAGVGFVLLIACVNVANLLLARATTRQRELAVRASLGASRKALFTQFLTESLVLAGVGGALGVALASGLLRVILSILPPYTLPSEADMRLSLPVLLFTLAVALVSGMAFGCAPAWQATRLNLSETLKDTSRSAFAGGRHPLRRILVAAQFALALTLLAGGGLAVHSLLRLTKLDLGIRTDHVLTFRLPVPWGRLEGEERVVAFYRQMLDRLQALPGVSSAAVSTGIPLEGSFGMAFDLVGRPRAEGSERSAAAFNMVSAGFFETFGVQLIKGRTLTDADTEGGAPVAVVNEAFAKRYLAGLDPLVQRITVDKLVPGRTALEPPVAWQIVGVYRDTRNNGPQNDVRPEIDVPFWQSPWPSARITIRTSGDPESVKNGVAAVVRSLDPELPLADVRTMEQVVRERLAGDRFSAILFGSFASIALLLAALGIYGVMSFAVAQRKHELGLRVALGATRGQVLGLVLRDGMATALVGTAVGFIGAYWLGRAMQGVFDGVPGIDTLRFAVLAGALLAAAALACYVPARRAAGVDPLTALRDE